MCGVLKTLSVLKRRTFNAVELFALVFALGENNCLLKYVVGDLALVELSALGLDRKKVRLIILGLSLERFSSGDN